MDGASVEAVVLDERGLTVPLEGGVPAYFNYWWLRDNCPTSFDRETRERTFDIFHLDAPPIPATARLADAGAGDRLARRGAPARAIRWIGSRGTRAASRGPTRPTSRAGPGSRTTTRTSCGVSQPRLSQDPGELRQWVEALLIEGVAIVTDMPDSDAGLTETAELIGQVRPTFFGRFFDVRLHVKPTNLAYTAKALELHTDVPAEDAAPGVQFLHCRANSVEGGLSLFVDGVAVAEALRAADPEAFRLLAETEVPFYKEHDGCDMRARPARDRARPPRCGFGASRSASTWPTPSTCPRRCWTTTTPPSSASAGCCRRSATSCASASAPGSASSSTTTASCTAARPFPATSGERHLRGCYTPTAGSCAAPTARLVSEGRFA